MEEKKFRFYYSDIDNYNEEYLKKIIWYQKEQIDNLRIIIKELNETKKKVLRMNKKVYNPVTKTYYGVKSKSSKAGKSGQIRGLWKYDKK